MNLYAESSAVLAWLLAEDTGRKVRRILAAAEMILASDLTLIECDRSLIRSWAMGKITEKQANDRRGVLNRAAARWILIHVDPEVVDLSRRPFPREPVRTLDALHLASAAVARLAVPGLVLLSLDERIRSNAQALGFRVVPD